jgi:hypothetical protein
MRTSKQKRQEVGNSDALAGRYLAVLLSQALVAFTVEFDSEFEHCMRESGYPGAVLSLVVWANLMQFLTTGDVSVRELAARALRAEDGVKGQLGCLERWRFVVLLPDPADDRPIPQRLHRRAGRMLRDGWGSGRGIRSEWRVHLTEKGGKAGEVWSTLGGEIEQRWAARFGEREVENLRQALRAIVQQLDLELPQGLPVYGHGEYGDSKPRTPPIARTGVDSLPVLLSQLLLAFTMEFDRESRVPLRLCANTLRVLGQTPVPLGEIPRLTGCSRETSDIGWEAKPYVAVERDPSAQRGKVARLTPLGLKAQRRYHELAGEIERRWEERFGKERIRRVRDCLEGLFVARRAGRLLLVEGLIPAGGTVRAGTQAPALGRREAGPAARQRMHDLVAQTEMFIRDPVNALPHYPLWDMNRGFGP